MGKIKGQKEYEKFLEGASLTRKQAILAQCYACNGENESKADCQGKSCPLYRFQPYRGLKNTEDGSFKAHRTNGIKVGEA